MVLLPKEHKGHKISLINTLVEENFTGVKNMGSRYSMKYMSTTFNSIRKVNVIVNKVLPKIRPTWTDSNEE